MRGVSITKLFQFVQPVQFSQTLSTMPYNYSLEKKTEPYFDVQAIQESIYNRIPVSPALSL